MRVLLVDDEKELVVTLAERLSFRGIDADWAIDGADALKKVAEASYDIAVVDIKMPRIGGIELKRMMAEKYPDMKFILPCKAGQHRGTDQKTQTGDGVMMDS